MQYICEDPVHVVVRNELPELIDASTRGVVRPKQRRVFAKFQRGVSPEWAREIGLATFGFKKMPEGVTAEQWLSFFDSKEAQQQLGWTDEEVATIDAKLRTIDGVIPVEKPRLAAPWPAYDRIVSTKTTGLNPHQVAEKIAEKVTEDGYDPGYVLAYEHENKGRKLVIAALEKLPGAIQPQAAELEEEEELIEA